MSARIVALTSLALLIMIFFVTRIWRPGEPLPKGALNLMILRALRGVECLPVPTLHVGHLLQRLLLVLPFPSVLRGLGAILLGYAPQSMLPRVVDDLHFFVSTSKTTKRGSRDLGLCAAPGGLHLGAVHGQNRRIGGIRGLHAPVLGGGLILLLLILGRDGGEQRSAPW